MITYIKNLFNRPKRERGVSRIQEGMLIHAVLASHNSYIPFLHTPWLHYFGFDTKPVARLVEDGYLTQERFAGWYAITEKGRKYLWEMVTNYDGNVPVTFAQIYPVITWDDLFARLPVQYNVGDEYTVKVAP